MRVCNRQGIPTGLQVSASEQPTESKSSAGRHEKWNRDACQNWVGWGEIWVRMILWLLWVEFFSPKHPTCWWILFNYKNGVSVLYLCSVNNDEDVEAMQTERLNLRMFLFQIEFSKLFTHPGITSNFLMFMDVIG